MEAFVFFASETGNGKDKNIFRSKREIALAKKVPKNGQVLFIKNIIGYSFQNPYSKFLKKELLANGISPKNIVILPGYSQGTVAELDAAEKYLKSHSFTKVWACSSWFHLPRIILMWLLRHQRLVYPFVFWGFSLPRDIVPLFLEPLKMPLMFFPAKYQLALGGWLINDILQRKCLKKH